MLVKVSFEDFFYILAGLIWLAFSIYKGLQKKKSKGATEKVTKKKSVLETLMDEFLEKEEQVQPESTVYEEPSKALEAEEKSGTEVFSYDDIYEKSNDKEVSDVYIEKPVVKRKPKTELKIPLKTRKIRRFDLRKAVIYSEILNRRYF